MGKRFDFTGFLAEERAEIAESLTEEEQAVFEARAKGASVVEASLRLAQSEATVYRRSRSIARKIERMHARARKNTTEYDISVMSN